MSHKMLHQDSRPSNYFCKREGIKQLSPGDIKFCFYCHERKKIDFHLCSCIDDFLPISDGSFLYVTAEVGLSFMNGARVAGRLL